MNQGLSSKEAARRRKKYGENAFKKHRVQLLSVLARQFQSSLTYLLIAASLLSFWLQDASDGAVIATILLINALLGFSQEYKSEKTVEKLTKLVSHHVLVKRDGKVTLLNQHCLVPGDLVIVKEGDIVPADLDLVQAENVVVNESQLSGESAPLEKSTERKADCHLFMGSTIEKGEGSGVVVAIGDQTELGKIAHLSSSTKKITQYEKSLQAFSSFLVKTTLLTLAVILVLKLGVAGNLSQISPLLIFIISLAVAVVPEALPVIATVTLASGALKLARQHVIVKKLSALEDLGNITLLCTDKTGTLTENKLTITDIVSENPIFLQVLAAASIETIDEKRKKLVSSFDLAFQEYIAPDIRKEVVHFKKLSELPFDPEDRRRRVVLEDQRDGTHYLVEIGSAETLLEVTKATQKAAHLKTIALDGHQGLRHLAVAYKKVKYSQSFHILEHEEGLHFLGFVKLEDPLRPTAKQTIERAQKLGIAIKILTGDSKEVAEYVGRELGLIAKGEKVYTGNELDQMHPEELREVLSKASIFAKVTPSQKYTIIKLLKEHFVVGYQGDGINDAPSLKLADVAIAVDSATDVAKDNADILLMKPDLGVIINGIQDGRIIFVNINKYIKYTMVGNFGNFFALAGLFLIGTDLPLLPIQLLLTSLLTDLPLIAISSDRVNEDEVQLPQKYDTRYLMLISIILGIVTMLFEFMFFATNKVLPLATSQTSFFLYLTFLQLAVIWSVRSRKHFWQGCLPSWQLTLGMLVVFCITVTLPYLAPFSQLFSFIPLPLLDLSIVGILIALYVLILDQVKVWYYKVVDEHLLHQVLKT